MIDGRHPVEEAILLRQKTASDMDGPRIDIRVLVEDENGSAFSLQQPNAAEMVVLYIRSSDGISSSAPNIPLSAEPPSLPL